MVQEISRELPGGLAETIGARMPVGQREAVDAPGLSARPAGLVGPALLSFCVEAFSRVRVYEASVISRAVGPYQQPRALFEMTPCYIAISGSPAFLGDREQQRHVHRTVDDDATALGRFVEPAPRLDHSTALPIARREEVRRPHRQSARLGRAGLYPSRIARQRVEKSQVVGVHA